MDLLISLLGPGANAGDVWALGCIAFLLLTCVPYLFAKKGEPRISEVKTNKEKQLSDKVAVQPQTKEPEIRWVDRLRKGLSKTRQEVWGKLENIVGTGGLNEEKIEEIEELLYMADIGSATVSQIIEELHKQAKNEGLSSEGLKTFLFDFLHNKMVNIQNTVDQQLYNFDENKSGETKVIMVVGVNGAGKTTTIGKLATKLCKQGANVYVGACDTFRAAAVDQLEVWCKRSGANMIRAKEGADPSGVAYEALNQARQNKADYCILDTAGRLHTKSNLMDELKKNKRVLSKLDDEAPHQVLLVIDAITGQNAMKQAEEFNKALGLTGLVFTKCDGSAKAGNAVSIVESLKVPITYIGVGESVEDLNIFNLDEYLAALLDRKDPKEILGQRA